MNYRKNKDNEEQYYKDHVLPKLTKIKNKSVPDELWLNIKNNIQDNNIKEKNKGYLMFFKVPQYAFATATVFIFITISAYSYQEISMYKYVNNHLNNVVGYLSSDTFITNDEIKI